MPTDIKKLIQAKKKSKDPMLTMMEGMLDRVLEEEIRTMIADAEKLIREIADEKKEELKKELQNIGDGNMKNLSGMLSPLVERYHSFERAYKIKIDEIVQAMEIKEGRPGNDGKDGKAPTREYLLDLIEPLIPEVKDGKDGEDGKAPTDEELETLIIPIVDEKIRVVSDILKTRRNDGGGGNGGGGMGNVVHETKSVSSGTTSVSTNYKIAGNGYAIWAYYQGALIVRGTHYTVGADQKTLTLLFTPQDSTSIDIIYIRT